MGCRLMQEAGYILGQKSSQSHGAVFDRSCARPLPRDRSERRSVARRLP